MSLWARLKQDQLGSVPGSSAEGPLAAGGFGATLLSKLKQNSLSNSHQQKPAAGWTKLQAGVVEPATRGWEPRSRQATVGALHGDVEGSLQQDVGLKGQFSGLRSDISRELVQRIAQERGLVPPLEQASEEWSQLPFMRPTEPLSEYRLKTLLHAADRTPELLPDAEATLDPDSYDPSELPMKRQMGLEETATSSQLRGKILLAAAEMLRSTIGDLQVHKGWVVGLGKTISMAEVAQRTEDAWNPAAKWTREKSRREAEGTSKAWDSPAKLHLLDYASQNTPQLRQYVTELPWMEHGPQENPPRPTRGEQKLDEFFESTLQSKGAMHDAKMEGRLQRGRGAHRNPLCDGRRYVNRFWEKASKPPVEPEPKGFRALLHAKMEVRSVLSREQEDREASEALKQLEEEEAGKVLAAELDAKRRIKLVAMGYDPDSPDTPRLAPADERASHLSQLAAEAVRGVNRHVPPWQRRIRVESEGLVETPLQVSLDQRGLAIGGSVEQQEGRLEEIAWREATGTRPNLASE